MNPPSEPMRRASLEPLQRFDQLTSLTLRLDCPSLDESNRLPSLLVPVLDSLRQLRCLELYDCEWHDSHSLWLTLRRLCSNQLLHVGLSPG